jgi:hypothetical protein
VSIVGALIGMSLPSSLHGVGDPEPESGKGYLLDAKGEVVLTRSGQQIKSSSACAAIRVGDVLSLGADGAATVLFPEGAYLIKGPRTFRVSDGRIVRVTAGIDAEVQPALAIRGTNSAVLHFGSDDLVMPPAGLLFAGKPLVMRQQKGLPTATIVLSPRSATLSRTPELVWAGDNTADYSVSVSARNERREGKSSFPEAKVKGCRLKWAQTGWPPLAREAAYEVIIREGDRYVLFDEEQTFWLLDEKKAESLNSRLADIDKALPKGQANLFVKANLLAAEKWGCYAEARLLAKELIDQEPENLYYLKLWQHCYAKLGILQGVEAIDKKIKELREK